MNEQIKELALKSGIAYLSEHTAYLTANDGLTVLPSVSSLEKFAELIVKQCAGIYSKIDNGNLHMGTDDYLEALHKTFFGVEESKGWVCSKCGIDRTKQECPKGYTAALTGECPMIGEAQ